MDHNPTENFNPDVVLTGIEDILAANLGEIYAQLSTDQRQPFKLKGEQVARAIHTMMVNSKVKSHQILKLIEAWLRMIPGVNVYFLQQEAKIKLDKIMRYLEEQAQSSTTIV